MKKILSIALCLLLAVSFFGCKSITFSKEINLRDKLSSLLATDEALGVKSKYNAVADIADGAVDSELTGTWKTADGETAYIYNEDGTAKAATIYGEMETKYTCITSGDYKVVCEETDMELTDADGNTTVTPTMTYSTYDIDNDVLYFTNVEETTDVDIDSSQYALMVMYRADENGSIEASLAKNSIALASFNGKWTCEKGEFTIADGTLTYGEDVYDVYMNDKGELVVDKDGAATAYSVNVSIRKQYDSEDKTQATETTAIGFYYTGADENDKPNLVDLLQDWKAEFDWNTYYYSGTFDLVTE